MATQDLYIHQNLASEGTSFVVTNEDERKKKQQEKDLLALAAMLKQIEVELEGAKKGATNTTAQEDSKIVPLQLANADDANGVNPTQVAMADMVLALQILQVEIAKSTQNKAEIDQQLAKGIIHDLQQALKDIENKLAVMAADEEKQKALNTGILIAEIIVTVIVSAVAIVLGQVGVAALMIAMTVASATGGIQKATDQVAKWMQEEGLNENTAKILAAVLIILVVAGATLFLAPASSAVTVVRATESAEETGEAIEMTEMDSSNIGKTASDATAAQPGANTASIGTRIVEALKYVFTKLNPLARLSVRANMVITNTLQTIGQTQLAQSASDAANAHASQEEKEKQELIAQGIVEGLTLLISVLSGGAMASGISAASDGYSEATAIGRMMNRLKALIQTTKGMVAVEGARQTASAIAGGLEGWSAVIQIMQGELQMAMASDNATVVKDRMAMDKNTEDVQASQKHAAQILQGQNTGNQSIMRLADGERGFATLFTQYSPV